MPSTARWAPALEHRVDVLGLAQPAADLDRRLSPRRDPLHVLEVPRRALAGAVEVDDVQAAVAPWATQRRAASSGSASKAVSRS